MKNISTRRTGLRRTGDMGDAVVSSDNIPAILGDILNQAKTPNLAIAISKPIAKANSLPENHFTIPLDTVIPAISTPQPNIIKPKDASFADAGNDVHQEFNQLSKPVPANAGVIA